MKYDADGDGWRRGVMGTCVGGRMKWVAAALLICGACRHEEVPLGSRAGSMTVPAPPREFRAAWVATVANIDWPSRSGLASEVQQAEVLRMLDRLVALNLNAVVLQVRPHADAIYPSAYEPWTSYLSGQQGRPPTPEYDPLQFWVEEAHRRGLQLHAWFNPYRANHPSNRGALTPSSWAKSRPDLVVPLGDKGYAWMIPTEPEVQDRFVDVVLDVVRRYPIDGVHLDDYFYPYPSYNDDRDFPDEAQFAAYAAAGGSLTRNDWRRAAVDAMVERLSTAVRMARPGVAFGISPFGIWRPGHPEGIAGFDQYEGLFADARRWLLEGWVDYLAPQLYWPIGQIPQSYPKLLGWWHRQNPLRRHVWPGLSVARAKGEAGGTEVVNQVMVQRGFAEENPGVLLFSAKWLMEDTPMVLALQKGPWASDALVPESPWFDAVAPVVPAVTRDAAPSRWIRWPKQSPPVLRYVVSAKRGPGWVHHMLPGVADSWELARDDTDLVVLRAVAFDGTLGPPRVVQQGSQEAAPSSDPES